MTTHSAKENQGRLCSCRIGPPAIGDLKYGVLGLFLVGFLITCGLMLTNTDQNVKYLDVKLQKDQQQTTMNAVNGTVNRTYTMKNGNKINLPEFIFKKKIDVVAWTEFYGYKISNDACPWLNCEFTTDKSKLNEHTSGVWFHTLETNFKHLPKKRWPHQRYIAYSREPPYLSKTNNIPPNFFNWSETYRSGATIFYPYGSKKETLWRTKDLITPTSEEVLKKKKKILWMVSNCHTNGKREILVKKLDTLIEVDIYGGCGKRADKMKYCKSCTGIENLISNYLFYLSLENSICTDYVTEKFWKAFTWNLVPIVFKRKIASPYFYDDAFIAIDDFDNMNDLVKHLNYLANNVTAYLEYFKWKERKIELLSNNPYDPEFYIETNDQYCYACLYLQLSHYNHDPPAAIKDFHKWFSVDAKCDTQFVDNFVKTVWLIISSFSKFTVDEVAAGHVTYFNVERLVCQWLLDIFILDMAFSLLCYRNIVGLFDANRYGLC